MNILSFFSLCNALAFLAAAIYAWRLDIRSRVNKYASAVILSFVWWSFCCAFFHAAPDPGTAWFWHRLSALGWIPFAAAATGFFFALAGKEERLKEIPLAAAFGAVPALLLVRILAFGASPVAESLEPSSFGFGWAYVPHPADPWLWLYIAYLTACFGFCFALVARWGSESRNKRFRRQARSIIILDAALLPAGMVLDLGLPLLVPGFPPLANILLCIWVAGFLSIIRKYKLITVFAAASPELILETILNPVLLMRSRGIIEACNSSASRMLKTPLDRIRGRSMVDFLASGKFEQRNVEAIESKRFIQGIEVNLKDSEGKMIRTQASFAVVRDLEDGGMAVVGSFHDIGKLMEAEAKLRMRNRKYKALFERYERLANYDPLTGLPNRRLFFERLEAALAGWRKSGGSVALAYLDLDGFKAVNDTWGHDAGDRVLVEAAGRLQGACPPGGFLARVGGDEFAVLLEAAGDFKADAQIAAFEGAFAQAVVVDGVPCAVGVSVGIARAPEDGTDQDARLKASDERMYRAKAAHKKARGRKPHFHYP